MADGEELAGRRALPPSVLALLTLLAVVVAGAVIWSLPHAQDDLTARSQLALAAAGFDEASVDFAGRDATVTGDVSSDDASRAIEDLLYGLRGVRRVDATQLTVVTAPEADDERPDDGSSEDAEATAEAASLTLTVEDTTVTVSGVVSPEEAVDTVAVAVADTFPGKQAITDGVRAGDGAGPQWLGDVDGIVRGLEGLESGVASISDDGVVIVGFAQDPAAASNIAAAVSSATSLQVSTEELRGLGPASFSAVAESGVVTLSGSLPATADVESVLAAAKAQFATVNTMLGSGGVRRPPWLDGLTGVFDATAEWRTWTIELGEDGGTFGGFAPSAEEFETLQPRLLGDLGIQNLAYKAEIEPSLVAADLTTLLEGSATFRTGVADLSNEATAVLDQVITILAANPSTRVTVEGHTDDQGSAAGNLLLSQARAQAVVDYLVEGGISPQRLTAVGYGEDRPIADNGTNEGRQQNRRIAFVVEPGGSG